MTHRTARRWYTKRPASKHHNSDKRGCDASYRVPVVSGILMMSQQQVVGSLPTTATEPPTTTDKTCQSNSVRKGLADMKALHDYVGSSLPNQPAAQLYGHEGPIQCVIFTADGKYCLTGGHDRSVRLWNPSRMDPAFPVNSKLGTFINISQSQRRPILPPTAQLSLTHALPVQTYKDGHTHPITSVAVDEKSTTLVAASEKTLVVTDVVTQKVKRRYQGHVARINDVAMSLGCETYLSASYDATVRIWDGRSSSHEPIQILNESKDSVTSVHVVQEHDDDSNQQQHHHHHHKKGNVAISSSTAIIRTASVDGVVRSYDLRKGLLQCDDCHAPITGMAPTRDGQCLAISGLDGIIRLMEIDSGELLNTYVKHHVAGNYGLQCCLTADDATIVSGSEDGRAVLYDLVRGHVVQSLEGHQRPTCAVAAHPKLSSVIITASYDGTAVVWAHALVSYLQAS